MRTCRPNRVKEAAVSIVEMLAIIAVLALLGALQLSALANQRSNTSQTVCADNLRRLSVAWQMYADDHQGRLVPNSSSTNDWVTGWLSLSPFNSANTNLALITQARLYPYARDVAIYRCPADLTAMGTRLRVRSYSMNNWVGEGAAAWFSGSGSVQWRLDQVRQPDRTFVFTEEHPGSLNDGMMLVSMDGFTAPSQLRIVDYPGSFHFLGANLSFADGSVQYRRWTDPRTTPPDTGKNFPLNVASPNNADVAWLQTVSTYRR
jgi:prepilin-type processing-associated H-X9-DG protein